MSELQIRFHKKQTEAFKSKATEILYGGAAGGGKSHLMRMAAILWCLEIQNLQVYLFRRIREDLIKNHVEGSNGFRVILAPLVETGVVKIVEDEIRFFNGSRIFLCHCKDEKDRFKYQGAEIHVLLVDELTHFTEVIYRFLRGRVRAVGLNIPDKYKDCFPRILCASNPGNIGHTLVKASFIDGVIPMECRRMEDSEGGLLRQYVPARLDDNPSMVLADPTYRARLRGLGSEALVRAMELGDWDIIEGAFFSEFSREKHVIKYEQPPERWVKYRSFDWGSARPFCVHWVAVSDGTPFRSGKILPRGALYVYKEWYGASAPNTGLKLTVEQVAEGIKSREFGEKIDYGVADPAIFAEDGGPSIGERFANAGVWWRPADNKRVATIGAAGGWDEVRARLIGIDDKPMLYFAENCSDIIRTLPALQHDESRPEDLDTNGEDHAADSLRYACMARPFVRGLDNKPTKLRTIHDVTADELFRTARKTGSSRI